MEAWIDIPKNSDFSIYNIPFGIFSTKNLKKRVGIAIGEMILDLKLSSFSFDESLIDKLIYKYRNKKIHIVIDAEDNTNIDNYRRIKK